jgi:outer membrane protein TolC
MKKTIILIILLHSIFCYSQTPLTLNQAIEIAQQSSLQMQINKLSFEIGKLNYKRDNATLLPQVNLNGNLPGYNNSISSITQPDGTIKFTTVEQAYSTGTLSLNQKIVSTGGTLSVSSGLNRFDRLTGLKSTNWQSQPVNINLNQPIFQFNNFKFNRKISKLNNQLNSKTYIESKEALALQVCQQFYTTLLSQKNLVLINYNKNVTDTLVKVAKTKLNIGKIDEDEYLQLNLQVIGFENALNAAQITHDNNLNLLLVLLNTSGNYELIDEKPKEQLIIDNQLAIQQAFKNRSDVLQEQINLENQIGNLRINTFKRLPNFTLNATYGFNQQSPVLTEAYKNALPQQLASVGVNMPIISFGANSANYKIAQHQLNKQKMQQDLYYKNLAITITKNIADYNLYILSYKLSVQADSIAQKRFAIALNKYKIGKITYTDLFIAQQQKDKAKTDLIQNQQNYWNAYFTLRKNTLYDFESGRSLVE